MPNLPKIHLVLFIILSLATRLASAESYPDFTKLVEKTAPTVVNVSATRLAKQNTQRGLLDNLLRRNRPSDESREFSPGQSTEGSGFIISADGYILTNRHVVLLADEIMVRMSNGREYAAKLIGEDSGTDVALLKIDGESLPVSSMGNSEQLKVGEWVLGFGAPFGFDQTVTAGIVSAKRRTLGNEQYVPYIQTDVAINPGNSGGPLVNLEGKVVGINSQILSRSGGYIGLSFAIPIELALNVAEQFKKYGKVRRGYLGVQYQDVTYAHAQWYKMDAVEGALLSQVTADSVADQAGLKIGDIVLKFDGKTIKRSGELPFIVGLIPPGETVKVDILRDGKEKQLALTVGERPDQKEVIVESETEPQSNTLGLILENINDEIRAVIESDGIIVSRVLNGPAARAGLRRQDIILSLGNRTVRSVTQFNELIAQLPSGVEVPILVLRKNGNHRFMSIRIP